MEIKYNVSYSMEVGKCNIDYLIGAFKQLLPMLLTDFISALLLQFAEEAMRRPEKPFACECGNNCDFIWKTRSAKKMRLTTIFAELLLPQLQVQCGVCGRKMFISRPLLGVGRYKRMSLVTERMLALAGALTTFRVSEKILGMFGIAFSRMRVWRCVQKAGKTISFTLDPKELPSGEADGTGIPIAGIKKRGMELKVFIQRKVGGGVRIAGLALGKYDSGWDKLFAPLRAAIKSFRSFLLVTDGDTSIFNGVKCVNVLLQRCLWHIPHQLKHCLWSDKVKRKSADWMKIMGKIFDITAIRPQLKDEEIEAVLEEKRERLDKLILLCEKREYRGCVSYLRNAKPDMFTALERRLSGRSSSLAERVMRTVNLRVNAGKWSPSGALNAMSLRLAHYYNDWRPGEPVMKGVIIKRL